MPTASAEPTQRVFLDTNVLLYLLSADEAKANTAEALLAQGGLVSVQVLNEAASVCLRKLKLPIYFVRAKGLEDIARSVRHCALARPYRIIVESALHAIDDKVSGMTSPSSAPDAKSRT